MKKHQILCCAFFLSFFPSILLANPLPAEKDSLIKRVVLPDDKQVKEAYISQDMAYIMLLDEDYNLFVYEVEFEYKSLTNLFTKIPELVFRGKYKFKEDITLRYSRSWKEGSDNEYGYLTAISVEKEPNKTYYLNPRLKTHSFRDCFEMPSHYPCMDMAICFSDSLMSESLKFYRKKESSNYQLLEVKHFELKSAGKTGVEIYKKVYEEIPEIFMEEDVNLRGPLKNVKAVEKKALFKSSTKYIPMKLKQGNYTIPVKLNGHLELDFIIDQNSKESVLTRKTLDMLKQVGQLQGEPKDVFHDESFTTARLASVGIDDSAFEKVWFEIVDRSFPDHFLVLGQNIINMMGTLEFDFINKVLIVHPN